MVFDLGNFGSMFGLKMGGAKVMGQGFNSHKSDIMTRELVFGSRVAQPNDEVQVYFLS